MRTVCRPTRSMADATATINRRTDELLTLYLNDVGRYPVLSRLEEHAAAQHLQKCRRLYLQHMLSTDYMLLLCVETLKKVARRDHRLESVFGISPRDRKRAKEIRETLPNVIARIEKLFNSDVRPDRRQLRSVAIDLIENLGLRPKIIREMWQKIYRVTRGVQPADADKLSERVREALRKSFDSPTQRRRRVRRLRQLERTWIAAQRRFTQHNLRLVVSIAKDYKSSRMPLLDLVQEGSLGLLIAAEKFESGRGFKFSTYASWWIKEMIQRGIRSQAQTIRLTEPARELLNRVNRQVSDLERHFGGRLNQETIDSALRLTRVERQSLKAIQHAPISIHRRDEENDCEISDVIPDTRTPEPSDTAHHRHLREQLLASLSKCKPRDRNIILWRFGLDGNWPQTLEAIADRISLSRERVRQIERELLGKLAHDLGAFCEQ